MSHLEEYLGYYKKLQTPGYAVLVTGEWGVGKTYQVKKCFNKNEAIYVSLFGLESIEQLHAEVFLAAHPTKAATNGLLKQAENTLSDAGGIISIIQVLPKLSSRILSREIKPDKVLIFDDLERSKIRFSDLLGAINTYVEHKDFRVVVIAHDEKLSKKFQMTKEKIFGQIIRVESQINEAAAHFINEISSSHRRKFINTHQRDILEIFRKSNIKSLRILRYVINDVERLHKCLTKKQLVNKDAMRSLIKTFIALDIETRAGNLSKKNIQDLNHNRYKFLMTKNGDGETTPPLLNIVDDKYPDTDFWQSTLNYEAVSAMFLEGRYPKNVIQKSINDTSYFQPAKKMSAWKILYDFEKLEDHVVDETMVRIKSELKNLCITNPGDILHIFCMRMLFSQGEPPQNTENTVQEFKTYIDDLEKGGHLPPRGTHHDHEKDYIDGYNGYGYWIEQSYKNEFEQILKHLQSAQDNIFQKSTMGAKGDLLDKMKTDPTGFAGTICYELDGDNKYVSEPIFKHIPAADFVNVWLNLDKKNWRLIKRAIEARYKHGYLEGELKTEKPWVQNLLGEIEKRIKSEDGYRSKRIERIKPIIDP